MVYKIDGTEITTQPTTARWVPREPLGIAGSAHAIYPGTREFELSWELDYPSGYNQLITFFNAIGVTGTAVVSLPQFGASTYTFFDYTGCVLREPTVQEYFAAHHTRVNLLITKIVT